MHSRRHGWTLIEMFSHYDQVMLIFVRPPFVSCQKLTVCGVPWHGSCHIRSRHVRSDHITSHHITPHHITSQHGSGAERQKIARNGSGIDENQHNLVKTAQNFDASPAVTTGMRQDPYLVSKRAFSGSTFSAKLWPIFLAALSIFSIPFFCN